jgi:putative endonuclease
VLDRNWRCRTGEVDVVALRDGVVVFAEVKCRRSLAFGPPALAVTPLKAARLRVVAGEWLEAHGLSGSPVRFDVVAVLRPARGAALVEQYEAAF